MKPELTQLDKYKGELDGEFAKVWVATDASGNSFVSNDLKLKQGKGSFELDLGATEWKPITNGQLQKIRDGLTLIETNKLRNTLNNLYMNEKVERLTAEDVKAKFEKERTVNVTLGKQEFDRKSETKDFLATDVFWYEKGKGKVVIPDVVINNKTLLERIAAAHESGLKKVEMVLKAGEIKTNGQFKNVNVFANDIISIGKKIEMEGKIVKFDDDPSRKNVRIKLEDAAGKNINVYVLHEAVKESKVTLANGASLAVKGEFQKYWNDKNEVNERVWGKKVGVTLSDLKEAPVNAEKASEEKKRLKLKG